MQKKIKILNVDDEQNVLDILGIYLKGEGYETCEALTGQEAISKAKAEHPDLIILDILMPEMDGFVVMRELKKNERTARIPVMVLTARPGEDGRREARKLGATGYLSKPFTEDELLREVKLALRGNSSASSQGR